MSLNPLKHEIIYFLRIMVFRAAEINLQYKRKCVYVCIYVSDSQKANIIYTPLTIIYQSSHGCSTEPRE